MPFNVNHEIADQIVKMTLSGELDAASAPMFIAALEKVSESKPRQLVLFVAELSFIASAGIRTLIFAMQRNRGIDVYLIAAQEQIVETIQRVGLGKSVIIQDAYPLQK